MSNEATAVSVDVKSTVIARVIVSQTYVHAPVVHRCVYTYTVLSRQAVRRTASRASRPRIRRRGGATAAPAHCRAHLDAHASRAPEIAPPDQQDDEQGPPRRDPPQRPTCRGGKKRLSATCRPPHRTGRARQTPAYLGLQWGRASACRQRLGERTSLARRSGKPIQAFSAHRAQPRGEAKQETTARGGRSGRGTHAGDGHHTLTYQDANAREVPRSRAGTLSTIQRHPLEAALWHLP